jgi:hypothetical protein
VAAVMVAIIWRFSGWLARQTVNSQT